MKSRRAEHLEILKREASKYLRMYANNASSAATGGIRVIASRKKNRFM